MKIGKWSKWERFFEDKKAYRVAWQIHHADKRELYRRVAKGEDIAEAMSYESEFCCHRVLRGHNEAFGRLLANLK